MTASQRPGSPGSEVPPAADAEDTLPTMRRGTTQAPGSPSPEVQPAAEAQDTPPAIRPGTTQTSGMAAVREADHGESALGPSERAAASRIDPETFREDLRIMQIAYGVMLTLGFRVIAEAYHSVLVNWKNHGWAIDAQFLLVTTVTLGISLLGTRFFFATNNIRRYIAARTLQEENIVRGRVVMIHFPILMLHSFMFFALAKTFESLCGPSANIRHVDHVVGAFGAMLVLNVLWLALLHRGRTTSQPEGLWMLINTVTVIALAVLVSPVFFSRLSWFDSASRSYWHLQPWCAAGVMLLNSVLNMGFASRAYLNKPVDFR